MGRTHEQRELASCGKRRCIKCNEIKDQDLFFVKRYHTSKDGLTKYKCFDSRCKSCMKVYSRKLKTENINKYCKSICTQLKHRAKKSKIPFDLTPDDLLSQWNLQNGKCYYSNENLDITLPSNNKSPHINYPSVDKLDPSIGYIKSNIVWCRWYINRMKNDLQYKKFVETCKLIADLHEFS